MLFSYVLGIFVTGFKFNILIQFLYSLTINYWQKKLTEIIKVWIKPNLVWMSVLSLKYTSLSQFFISYLKKCRQCLSNQHYIHKMLDLFYWLSRIRHFFCAKRSFEDWENFFNHNFFSLLSIFIVINECSKILMRIKKITQM